MRPLSDEGYLVASFDNSGTPSPKGRAWRKVIYGSVGVSGVQAAGRGAAIAGCDQALGGLDARGRVGLERWRLHDR